MIKQYWLFFILIFGWAGLPAFSQQTTETIIPAADRPEAYLSLIEGKKIALVTNQTGRAKGEHIVDFLLGRGIDVQKIFAPEHGFRGNLSAGKEVADGKDIKTGIPIVSIYGKNKKPSAVSLAGIELILFDIQDVGVRFYTYISSMSYVMEAAAEQGIPFVVLDRPNPNGYFIDGPVLKPEYQSFVGLHPVPVVYGMTIGEYALMVKGEDWINRSDDLELKVIPVKNYTHDSLYRLPVPPSPNLPDMRSIYLYPSICYFEGTCVSVGRGTDYPFQMIGYPGFAGGDTVFIPHSIPGKSIKPPFVQEECNGLSLRTVPIGEIVSAKKINWTYVWLMYLNLGEEKFFLKNGFFDLLAGNEMLRKALVEGKSIEWFRESYREDLAKFRAVRQKYLIYD